MNFLKPQAFTGSDDGTCILRLINVFQYDGNVSCSLLQDTLDKFLFMIGDKLAEVFYQ